MRRTKIVATMGPATDTPESVEAMIRAGVDVVRMNFSHWRGRRPYPACKNGTAERVGIAYKNLPNDVYKGDELLLDDGRIVLKVLDVQGEEIHTEVVVGGDLSNNKGINKRGGGISAEALTEKDKEDIKTAAKIGVDFLAVSFPRSAADLEYARLLMHDAGGDACNPRGDLGVEIGDANLPLMQKKLIKRARNMNCAVITATQMMETMIDNTIPTRAEVFDVANAVMDGTDAVMLSGETAVGKHPAKVVAGYG
ncbi:Pyruvate kinase [Nymphon striatum]|nr:Pyruvate kinase [Nymphon striatum]